MEEVDQIDEDEPESHEEILPLLEEATLNQYASQDDDLFTCSSIDTESDWEQQLINRVVSGFETENEDEDDNDPIDDELPQEPPVVSVQEAARMVEELRRFGIKNNKHEIVDATLNIERLVMQLKFDKQKLAKQSVITNFFTTTRFFTLYNAYANNNNVLLIIFIFSKVILTRFVNNSAFNSGVFKHTFSNDAILQIQ
jgi:hypothetical protein